MCVEEKARTRETRGRDKGRQRESLCVCVYVCVRACVCFCVFVLIYNSLCTHNHTLETLSTKHKQNNRFHDSQSELEHISQGDTSASQRQRLDEGRCMISDNKRRSLTKDLVLGDTTY